MDKNALERVDRAMKSVIDAIGDRPDELLEALNTLHGKEAGYPDPLYMSPPERERVIRGAAEPWLCFSQLTAPIILLR